jgi:hypothetical protein
MMPQAVVAQQSSEIALFPVFRNGKWDTPMGVERSSSNHNLNPLAHFPTGTAEVWQKDSSRPV